MGQKVYFFIVYPYFTRRYFKRKIKKKKKKRLKRMKNIFFWQEVFSILKMTHLSGSSDPCETDNHIPSNAFPPPLFNLLLLQKK